MKRLLLVSILMIACGAVLLELIRNDTGYVLIAMGSKTIEMSFWVAVALLLLAVLALWLCSVLTRRVLHLASGGLGIAAKRNRKAQQRTATGLMHFLENNWAAARKDLLRAANYVDNPAINYLAAARCSHELGNYSETQQLLQRAEQMAPQNELAVVLSQARIQLLDKKYEQCLATLHRARALAPKHPTVLNLLREVYWQLRDWQSLQDLLPELRKQKLYQKEEQELLEQNVYMALLSNAGTQAAKSRNHGTVPQLTASAEEILTGTWQRLPKNIRAQEAVINLYSKLLLEANLPEISEKLLRQTLARHWQGELVTTYGLIDGPQPKEQLIVAEQWLREHPGDSELLLALGRLSVRNQLWGKAREYFEASLKLKPRAETYAELARLLAHLGEHEKSTELYQQGLLASTPGLPKLPMPLVKKPENRERRAEDREKSKLALEVSSPAKYLQ